MAATPDGGYLYRQQNSTRNLYTVEIDPDTGGRIGRPRQLTTMDDSRAPGWSPDGQRVAYFSMRGPLEADLSVQSESTPGNSQLLQPPTTVGRTNNRVAPQWLPDGQSLLVLLMNQTLARVDTRTRHFTPVLPAVKLPVDLTGPHRTAARLSHDGRTFFYFPSGPLGQPRPIVRLDMETGAASEVARVQANQLFGLAISADDRQLAFVVGYGPNGPQGRSIMIVPATGGQPREVHRVIDLEIRDLAWSRDGQRLFYTSGVNRIVQGTFTPAGGDIWTVGIDGTDPRPLGVGLNDQYYLNIHSSGRQLLFMDENSRNELWMLRLPASMTRR
jgi:Tol biopolymer transport system component